MKRLIILVALIAGTLTTSLNVAIATAQSGSQNLYVSPTGSDSNDGKSASAAFLHIQKALDIATPGTTITLAPGEYIEALVTKSAGTAEAPITIKGSENGFDVNARHNTTLYAPFNSGDAINVKHSYYNFDGFTIDGQYALRKTVLATDPTALVSQKNTLNANGKAGTKCDQASGDLACDNRLIYVGRDAATNLKGIKINNMLLTRGGGECVRLHNNTTASIVTNSVVSYCGMNYKDTSSSGYAYHNGEAIYIGTSTSSSQRDQTKHPLWGQDTSSDNIVRNNVITTYGSECFEVKEHAHNNTFDHNNCSYSLELPGEDSSLAELRGDHNIVTSNKFYYSTGAAIKIRSDATPSSKTFSGVTVQNPDQGGNYIKNNTYDRLSTAMILMDNKAAQGTVCGNSYNGTLVTGDNKTLIAKPTDACSDGSTNADAGANVKEPASQSLCTPATTPGDIGSSTGSLQRTITVPSAASYKLFFRVKGTETASGTLAQVTIDGCQDYITLTSTGSGSDWYWAGTSKQNPAWTLAGGNHTISITGVSAVPNFALDTIMYTTNLNCMPSGNNGDCAVTTSPSPSTPAPQTPAQIVSISPKYGSTKGKTKVTLKISGFPSGTPSVSFGGKGAKNIQRTGDGEITLVTPEHAAGNVTVTVKIGDRSATGVYAYVADTVPTLPSSSGSSGGSSAPSGSGGNAGQATPTNVNVSLDFNSTGSEKDMEVISGGKFSRDSSYYKLADVSKDKLNLTLVKTALTGNYQITAVSYAKSTDPTNGTSIVFAYRDSQNYAYVNFAEKTDSTNNGFFVIQGGKTTKVASLSSTTRTGTYQALTIKKVGGQVSAFIDAKTAGVYTYSGLRDGRFGIASVNTSLRIDSINANTIN